MGFFQVAKWLIMKIILNFGRMSLKNEKYFINENSRKPVMNKITFTSPSILKGN